ncbi:MAG TPA: hypothetical protein VF665_24120 [Longimicrobium sp.]|jgi:hypothetical protein|uniref:hypothetical protein n=1 Tax=Longimicrobium sp. TaxID=2029185 RepID=UPI002EDACA07
MNAVQTLAVMMMAGCASAPHASSPAPQALATVPGQRNTVFAAPADSQPAARQNVIVRKADRQPCATGDAMPNGRPRDTAAVMGRHRMPGTPAPMPNACPAATERGTTLAVPGAVPEPRP